MDFTKLEKDNKGFQYLLVITEIFTKFAVAVTTKNQKASTVAYIFIDKWLFYFRPPTKLHSDQRKFFDAEIAMELCKANRIKKTRIMLYHPEGNSVTESLNITNSEFVENTRHKREELLV